MDKATKTKIIVLASFGLFVLVVVAVCLALNGGSDKQRSNNDANTSLRAQTESDFTLDDMMRAEGRPDYENFTDEVYQERASSVYTPDPEAIALQEQLRQNQMQQQSDSVPKKVRTAKKAKKPKAPEPPPPPKTGRFFSGEKAENKGNTIEAIVSGDQRVTSGSVLKLVTLQELTLDNGLILDKGTALFGVIELKQDRIKVKIESVRIGNNIYNLKKTVYDKDGLEGINVPLNIKAEASKEAADQVVNDVNVTPYSTDVLSTGVNAVSSAAKSVFRKRNNQIIVTIKSNYKLYLK